jgi:hypothetical protein
MKKFLLVVFVINLFIQPSMAWSFDSIRNYNSDEKKVERLLNAQVRYANRTNFNKFISTYDKKYVNSDGFNLEIYSDLIKDIWKSYDNLEYGIQINKITVDGNSAIAELIETAEAKIILNKVYNGELKSKSNSIYKLEKIGGKWKVVSDSILDETTTMLYGNARDLDIKLTVPNPIEANTDYTATLEFAPPKGTMAIASIAADKVEYPQKQTKEVFRALPEDNILERIFTSNNDKANEYIVASIGLTQTSVCDLSIKLNLIGFGYAIKRVNVIPQDLEDNKL